MEQNKIKIGITQGDVNGIGYEIILKAFEDPTIFELCTPIVYGSPKVTLITSISHHKDFSKSFFHKPFEIMIQIAIYHPNVKCTLVISNKDV